jgi:hypothetical protein
MFYEILKLIANRSKKKGGLMIDPNGISVNNILKDSNIWRSILGGSWRERRSK